MTNPVRCLLIVLAVSFLSAINPGKAQAQDAGDASLEVFLDCNRRLCDSDYIRREIGYVNWVRDRQVADVHLLVTEQRTGSGGRNYQMNFIGLEAYSAVNDTLFFASSGTDTGNEVREGMTRVMAAGLIRYLAYAGKVEDLIVRSTQVTSTSDALVAEIDDPWNSWFFSVSMSPEFEAEESRETIDGELRISANRVTEEWKFRTSIRADYTHQTIDLSDRTVTSTRENANVWMFLAKSIDDHWSAGASASLATSTSQNTKLSSTAGPELEYNIFPYSESSERQFRLQYAVKGQYVEYEELTIFNKMEENLLQHSFEARLDFRQPWGSANASVEASQYLTDFEKSMTEYYSIELRGSVNVRLIRGLSLSLGGSVQSVHDQLYIAAEEQSDDDILLGNVNLPTSFEYDIRIGLSYSFGSIYNNVVNPRFGF
jgi:hypothetical protein